MADEIIGYTTTLSQMRQCKTLYLRNLENLGGISNSCEPFFALRMRIPVIRPYLRLIEKAPFNVSG